MSSSVSHEPFASFPSSVPLPVLAFSLISAWDDTTETSIYLGWSPRSTWSFDAFAYTSAQRSSYLPLSVGSSFLPSFSCHYTLSQRIGPTHVCLCGLAVYSLSPLVSFSLPFWSPEGALLIEASTPATSYSSAITDNWTGHSQITLLSSFSLQLLSLPLRCHFVASCGRLPVVITFGCSFYTINVSAVPHPSPLPLHVTNDFSNFAGVKGKIKFCKRKFICWKKWNYSSPSHPDLSLVDDTPETCIYSGWSPWSACSSSTCEKGRRMRQRMLKAQLDLSVPCPHTQDFQPCMGPGCSREGKHTHTDTHRYYLTDNSCKYTLQFLNGSFIY